MKICCESASMAPSGTQWHEGLIFGENHSMTCEITCQIIQKKRFDSTEQNLCSFHSQEMPSLEQLTLRFTGSRLADVSGLVRMLDTEHGLAKSLRSLHLWFTNLPLAAEFLRVMQFHADVILDMTHAGFGKEHVAGFRKSGVPQCSFASDVQSLQSFRSLVELGSWEPLAKLQLEELVLQLKRCGQVPPEAKQSLTL